MKNKKIFLDIEDEKSIIVQLMRLTSTLPDYEIFFKINQENNFQFKRIEDLKITLRNTLYFFPRFRAYDQNSKNCFYCIANKSTETQAIRETFELFSDKEEIQHLFPQHREVDYILYAEDNFVDFSVILLPENLFFQHQEYLLEPEEKLYDLLQYYE